MHTLNRFSQSLQQMRRKVQARLAIGLAGLMLATAAQAQYSFITIGYPGADGVQGWGLNTAVRVPVNAYGAGMPADSLVYDFSTGTLTPITPVGGGISATALGINNAGVLVGSYTDGVTAKGFTLTGGVYDTFWYPGGTSTYGRGINNSGLVAGYADLPSGGTAGFLLNTVTSSMTSITFPGANFVIAQGVNSAGVVVGNASMTPGSVYAGSPGGQYAWVRQPSGAVTFFRVNGLPTRARGINDAGEVAGWFNDTAAGDIKGYVTSAPVAGGYVSVPVAAADYIVAPGAEQTFIEGINNAGFISGSVYYPDGSSEGFVAVPPGVAAVKGLSRVIDDFGLAAGIEKSLLAKLDAAATALDKGDTAAACGALKALINQASALAGKKLTKEQAEIIISSAEAMRKAWGC